MAKKILVVTDVMGRGGVDTYTVDLVKIGLSQGWQIEVVVDTSTTSSIAEVLHSVCRVYKGPLYHRQNDISQIESFYSLLLKEYVPDLVHISCGIPWGCLRVREITLEQNIPLLFTEHYAPPNLILDANLVKHLTKIYQTAQGIIHVSEENFKNLWLKLPLSISKMKKFSTPIYIIPNGVEVDTIQLKAPSQNERLQRLENHLIKGHKLQLLAIARLTQQKGIDLLINPSCDL